MGNQAIDLTTMGLEKLKSLAYDQMVELQRVQNNLAVINQEIEKKSKEEIILEPEKDNG